MFKKVNSTTLIALCTGASLIAFAVARRYEASITIPTVLLYLAAAVICLLPVISALFRHRTCARS